MISLLTNLFERTGCRDFVVFALKDVLRDITKSWQEIYWNCQSECSKVILKPELWLNYFYSVERTSQTNVFEETNFRDMSLHLVSCLCFSFVNVVLLNISSHSKVCHFTGFSFTNQHISSCQVTVDDLKQKVTGEILIRGKQTNNQISPIASIQTIWHELCLSSPNCN